MLRGLRSVERVLTGAVKVVGGLLIVAMVAVVSVGVFTRYILLAPIEWSEELARFLMVWIALLGAAVGVRTRAHYGILLLTDRLPAGLQAALRIFADLCAFAFALLLVRFGLSMVQVTGFQTSPNLQVPMSVPYAAIPIGGALMLFYVLLDFAELAAGKAARSPQEAVAEGHSERAAELGAD